ncbi:uncharacterized protein EV154DRAFT_497382 [Mucor mucedo]|uniref:uncharacterized protein n=1 Tax=Mucor mucedo TaxID=29922 RepID=UPI00221FE83D|nr:uncharacterized protein EV154DRAFT_497382 [Mucor mucedo]KAI7894913.1 hypothetical protein EV154DRAFT_497382 [Mucor mucedo]
MRYYTDRVSDLWKTFSKGSKDHTWHSYQVCVLQLPHTSTYDSTVAAHCDILEGSYQHRNNIYRQSEILHKVLLEYKYQQFIRRRLFYLFAIHIVYYITFSTGVVFSQELNNNIIETKFRVRSPGQMASIGLMCAAAVVLMLQKICQFWTSSRKLSWLCSIYHWIDIAAVILPVFTFVHMINGWSHFSELCSATTLILWIHAIFRIRVIPSFGYIIETVIETARIVRSVVIVMLVVVFMFTNTNMVLIHLKPDEYYQENYNVIYSGVVGSDNSFGHSSGSYGFSNVFRSFSQICYFIYGSWDPANDGAEVESIIFIKVVSILFSVMTLVMLFNLLITIRANRLDDIRKHARGIW